MVYADIVVIVKSDIRLKGVFHTLSSISCDICCNDVFDTQLSYLGAIEYVGVLMVFGPFC